MNIFEFWKALFCFAWMPLYISSSKAKTSSETNNIDQRLALESGAVGASASGSSRINISTLDGGAIKQAFGLGEHAIDKVTTMATSSQSAAAHTAELALDGALSSIGGAQQAFESARKDIATAYEDAKVGSRTSLNTMVMVMGGAVVLVIAMAYIKKG